jgi:hypothetical protein
MHEDQPSALLTKADCARLLGVTPEAVRLAAKDGRLPVAAWTAGGIRLFCRQDVEGYRERRLMRLRARTSGHEPAQSKGEE